MMDQFVYTPSHIYIIISSLTGWADIQNLHVSFSTTGTTHQQLLHLLSWHESVINQQLCELIQPININCHDYYRQRQSLPVFIPLYWCDSAIDVKHNSKHHSYRGYLAKRPYLPCVSMADRALLARYLRYRPAYKLDRYIYNIWWLSARL